MSGLDIKVLLEILEGMRMALWMISISLFVMCLIILGKKK